MGQVLFSFADATVAAREGDSITAALSAAGVQRLGTRRSGMARGQYCGMGICQDCLVTVDGRRSVRACMTEVRPGMVVVPQDDAATPVPVARPDAPALQDVAVDLAIVGGGPAGLEAAIAAAAGGLGVLVLDERSVAGGQYFKPPSAGSRRRPADRQHRLGEDMRARLAASGAEVVLGASVWFARRREAGFELRYAAEREEHRVTARALILATGAHERAAVVPGAAGPGVMTIGAAQTLVRRYGVAPGRRVLIAGEGPLGLQLAAELQSLGARVVGVAERSRMAPVPLLRAAWADPRLALQGAGYLLRLARAGIPVWRGTEVVRIAPQDRNGLLRVTLRGVGEGDERQVEADTLCISEGFQPQLELARLLSVPVEADGRGGLRAVREPDGATQVAGLWIAGDGGGMGGAQIAGLQGRLAGLAALRLLGGVAPDDPAARRRLSRAGRFQRALWTAFGAPARGTPADDAILCRCESVPVAAVREAIGDGATDPGAVKRATRCGMGRCQGRLCSSGLVALLGAAGHAVPPETHFAPQLPARPVPAAMLLREKPEWGGHAAALPAERPRPPDPGPLPAESADVVVIGAGVTGLCAALAAARAGASVICLDRGQAAAEASGGNAGSLHLQLLSWDFGQKAVAGGSPALRTLPLQAESIALWSALETELGADFEMATTGGLVLAENPEQVGFLRDKAAAEATVGIETHIVSREEIAGMEPALADIFAAAAWCPGEGKINPLAANRALLGAVRAAGAQVIERCRVTGIQPEGEGYRIATARGAIRAGRVVLAAGGWSAGIAEMLSVAVPVRGAPLQMVVTEPAPPLVGCLVAHADRHLTLKQTAAGSILIGGAWPGAVGPAGQPIVLPESLEGNLWVAARTLPAVAGLSVIRSWAAMNIDIDGAPLLSHLPGHPRVVIAATSNGYTLGPLIGREAALGLLHGRMRQDLHDFGLDRFQAASTGKAFA
jgi:glycine/D-amino acid oxidase-like deaminating enzyme/NADPH-dependent 2,4-dienoyl-CoA reductase/sulfur reductase-like enzyme